MLYKFLLLLLILISFDKPVLLLGKLPIMLIICLLLLINYIYLNIINYISYISIHSLILFFSYCLSNWDLENILSLQIGVVHYL